jgi:hypothetical protein
VRVVFGELAEVFEDGVLVDVGAVVSKSVRVRMRWSV